MSNIEIDRNPKGTKEEIDKIRGKIIKNIIEHKLAGKPVDINSAGEIVIKLIKDHDSKDVEEAMYQVHEWMDKIKKDIKEELEEPKDFKTF